MLILWISKISADSLDQIEVFITYFSNDLQGRIFPAVGGQRTVYTLVSKVLYLNIHVSDTRSIYFKL